MANIQMKSGHWEDLGKLLKKRKIKTMNRFVFRYIFEYGVLTIGEKL